MEFIFWGTRGSIACHAHDNRHYGSNTTCVQLKLGTDLIAFDAGTGLFALAKHLPKAGTAHVFISHIHPDHIQGLHMFRPFYQKGWQINLYVPVWIEDLLHDLFDGNKFPVRVDMLQATITTHTLHPEVPITLRSGSQELTVTPLLTNHPGKCFAFKGSTCDKTFLISGDHEISPSQMVQEQTASLLDNVDLAIVDANFLSPNFPRNHGHSYWRDWYGLAQAKGVKQLVLTHHAPDSNDESLDKLQDEIIHLNKNNGLQAIVAYDKMQLAPKKHLPEKQRKSTWLRDFIESLHGLSEESAILDTILYKTREICQAEAGTFYLAEDDELVFSYAHNDVLFPQQESSRSVYINNRLPINRDSVCGYVGVTKKKLHIENVNNISKNQDYQFDNRFDIQTGYQTRSLLTLPVLTQNNELMGVLQLINSKDCFGNFQNFSRKMQNLVDIVVHEAAVFLEMSLLVRSNVYQLLRVAQLHDPSETGPHAERVGAIAAEIYQRYADKKGISDEKARHYKSQLRIAAMLHDIGKIGISDMILKKPGKFTPEERAVMETHAALGAELLSSENKELYTMVRDIALHHHQKWNGTGYPAQQGTPLAGEEIPLSARVTAVADVFDALVSKRCYKEAFPVEVATQLLVDGAGAHFDPELVEYFLEIPDTITMIYERYADQPDKPRLYSQTAG